MLDSTTNEPHVAETTARTAEVAEKTKRPKASTSYDAERHIAYINQPGHEAMSFNCADIPANTRMALAGTQICAVLIGSKDGPEAALERLKAGVYGRKAAVSKEIDPWRRAAAMASADEQAKAQGLKALPGKRLADHPDHKLLVENALQVTAAWPREKLAAAKKIPAVVAHHAGLTGVGASVSALFE